MSEMLETVLLDARGLFCPEPVMLLHKKIREVEAGQLVKVLAPDPSTQRDIAKFCNFLEHRLVEQQQLAGEYHFLIEKKAE